MLVALALLSRALPSRALLTVLLLALSAPVGTAEAGTLIVDALAPAEVRLDDEPLLTLWAPMMVAVEGLSAGPHVAQVTQKKDKREHPFNLPSTGNLRLLVADKKLSTDVLVPPAPAEGEEAAPVVELKPTPGQRFAILLDGKRLLAVGPTYAVRLDGVPVGAHAVEIRSGDLQNIWNRGTLTLAGGDSVTLVLNEGRAPTATGTPNAWRVAE